MNQGEVASRNIGKVAEKVTAVLLNCAKLLKVPLAKIEGLKFFDNAGVK